MKNEFQTWTIAVALAALTACGDRTEQVNYLKDAPVVATRDDRWRRNDRVRSVPVERYGDFPS